MKERGGTGSGELENRLKAIFNLSGVVESPSNNGKAGMRHETPVSGLWGWGGGSFKSARIFPTHLRCFSELQITG